MNVLVQAEVLAVGIENYYKDLRKLPARITSVSNGRDAVSSLKNKNFNVVVSKWELADMPDGRFLKGLKLIRPGTHSVAIVESQNFSEEIAARACGVNAVVSVSIDPEQLNSIIASMAGISIHVPQTVNNI